MGYFDRAPTGSKLVNTRGFIQKVWIDWFKSNPPSGLIQDTRGNRINYSPSDNPNAIYRESDTTLKYVSDGTNWIYDSGSYRRIQSQIAALVAVLGVHDAGLLIDVTDFTHTLRWDGAALGFAPGDDGSNYLIDATSAPLGKTVQLCDGTVTSYLKADGTLQAYTTKNLAGHYRKSVTAAADALVAAVAPGISGTTAVASTGITVGAHPDHAHTVNANLGTPHLYVEDLATGHGGFTSGAEDGGGSPVTLSHAVTDPTHQHTKGTIAADATGEPATYKVLTYLRR